MSKMLFFLSFHQIMREMCVMSWKMNLIISKIHAIKFLVFCHLKLFSVTKMSSDCQLCAVNAKIIFFINLNYKKSQRIVPKLTKHHKKFVYSNAIFINPWSIWILCHTKILTSDRNRNLFWYKIDMWVLLMLLIVQNNINSCYGFYTDMCCIRILAGCFLILSVHLSFQLQMLVVILIFFYVGHCHSVLCIAFTSSYLL